MINKWVKGLLLGMLLLLPGMATAQQATSQVIIVKSSDNTYFKQSIETLVGKLPRKAEYQVVTARELADGSEIIDDKSLVVTLGQSAADAVSRLDRANPSINAYLTLEQFKSYNRKNQLGVLLDQPLHRYLAFSKLILAVDSIGIIEDQKNAPGPRQTRLLGDLELELNQYQIDPVNKLLPVLRRLLKQNDALLMLPRQSIYNRDTLKGVLLTSYRNHKPAISYSPAHVKSGALASIYSSPADIGMHLALLVNRRLQQPDYQAPAFEYARFYSIATNRRVARALEISLPSESELRSALDRLKP